MLELREDGAEHSFTDMVKLIVIDHPSGVQVGSDEAGNIGTYSDPSPPMATTLNGNILETDDLYEEDSIGIPVYHQDFIEVRFGDIDITQGAYLILRGIGFGVDDEKDWGDKTYQQPTLQIQTIDEFGDWVTRNTFFPRDN